MSVSDGLSSSEGDPRVLFVLNAVLSASFAAAVLAGAGVVGFTEFTWPRLAALTILLMVVTYVVTY